METNEEKRSYSARKDHSGEEYGDLKILRPDTDSDRGTVYICRCKKCGWEGSIRLDSIKKYGHTSKCNCTPSPSKTGSDPLIGQDFGKLKILRRDQVDNSKYTFYICKCKDCGWEGSLRLDNIRKYQSTSKCNCKVTRNVSKDTTSLIGRSFGDLKVLSFDHMDKYGVSVWNCKCMLCGNIIQVPKNNLVSGNTTKCLDCKYNNANNRIKSPISFAKKPGKTPSTKPFFRVIPDPNKQ
jgi:hypothetical protein